MQHRVVGRHVLVVQQVLSSVVCLVVGAFATSAIEHHALQWTLLQCATTVTATMVNYATPPQLVPFKINPHELIISLGNLRKPYLMISYGYAQVLIIT